MIKFLAISFLVFTTIAHSAEISNFKAGLACTDAKTFGWICHESVKIFITGQGTCTFNNEEVPCTWHGFQFEYKDFNKDTVFECTSTYSESANVGNPEEVTEENTTAYTYRIDILEGDGLFFNPQYRVLTTRKGEPSTIYEHTECYLNDVKQVEYNLEFVFPASINP